MAEVKKIIIDIIIVNWNGEEYLAKAISPLLEKQSQYIDLNIIISDNGSTDKSLTQVNHLPVVIIQNGRNIGFGAACNKALPACIGDYVLLLNPDTESTLDTIEKLVKKIEQHPEFGVIGPRQNDRIGNIQHTCGRFPTFSTSLWEMMGLSKIFPGIFKPAPIMFDWDHATSREVDHIMGCYMLIRKSVIDYIGFMDDHFFVYLEDIDFSRRVKNAGFKSYYFHDTAIFHEQGGMSKRVMAKRFYFSLSSKIYYWRKHFGKASSTILKLTALTVEPMARILHALISLNPKNAFHLIKAYQYLFKEVFLGKKTY